MPLLLRLILSLTYFASLGAYAIEHTVSSPDKQTQVIVSLENSSLTYSIKHNGDTALASSNLGISLSDREFYQNISELKPSHTFEVNQDYQLATGKQRQVHYHANERYFEVTNKQKQQLALHFRVSNDGVAFRYIALNDPQKSNKQTITLLEEHTSFHLPQESKAWLQPIAEAQTGWEHTNPSYEEHYLMGIPVTQASPSTAGWVFPALFQTKQQTWLAITEAGIKPNHNAARLAANSPKGIYKIGQPQAPEVFTNQGLLTQGTLPLDTPWRVIALGSLETLANSTLGTDLAEPAIELPTDFIKPGISSWSWGLLKDDATIYPIQKDFIDHAADMNWQYALVDTDWDQKIGDKKMAELVQYAKSKQVGIFVWYNSSGDWNTTKYTPKSQLHTASSRQAQFAKLHKMGIKGVKIDFFAGDGQSMMQYYHDILQDAAKYQLMVNFHGTTLPRGLQRTYPNLLTSEAVRGFEMITFFQNAANKEASHSAMLPFSRNLFDPMDFTPTTFNDIPNIERKTTNGFQLALPILFTSGIQHIVETPAGMKTTPAVAKSFLQQLPVQWDESRFITGFPGKLAIFARRSGDTWFIAGINGEEKTKALQLDLSFLAGKQAYMISSQGERGLKEHTITLSDKTAVNLAGNDGFVMRIDIESQTATPKMKIIDQGGSGPFKAIAMSDGKLPDYVIYRPEDIKAAVQSDGPLPVMIFANGGCNDTSLPFERMLSQIASQGYLVIALGEMQQSLDDRPLKKSPNAQMPAAIDWLSLQSENNQSDYYQSVDLKNIAFTGQSCGGAQVLAMASDPRVSSYIMFNSGIGNMTMAAASQEDLANLHAPIVYIVGGKSDVAYENARLDYQRIKNVPIAFANAIHGGHSGTYEALYGGSFTQMALKWLDWQLKGEQANADIFLQNNLSEFPDWTMDAKQF